ncbi:MAG: cyclic nucleotide-binding domain-containing protein [Myxococcales bacterium]|nr:cyclic nucleotide-binding domain-containing protein [Myxococcales bacterium]
MNQSSDSQQLRACLEHTAPFSASAPATLERLVERSSLRSIAAGEPAFVEGDPSLWVFVVLRGSLAATARAEDGRDVSLRTLSVGDLGGLTALDATATRSASLRAIEDATLAIVEKRAVREALESDSSFATALVAYLGEHIRSKTRQIATAVARVGRDPREQIAFFDAKPYERAAFERRLSDGLRARWIEAKLDASSAAMADGYPVVCAFVNDTLDATVIERIAAGGTCMIALRCAGYNNVDLAAAERHGIDVARVPAYSPHAVAEHAVALLLTLTRKTHRAYARVREGNFSLHGLVGFDLHGRTAGVIGLGKIGRCAAELLRGFGMRVLASDPTPDDAFDARVGVERCSVDALLERSDVVTLHAPLTPDTWHLLDARRFALMKRGAVLINTSRGGLVDTRALIDALKSQHLGAAGLDVYEEESEYFFRDRSDKVITDDVLARLMTFNNVLVTSHQAFLTEDALDNIAETTVANVREWLDGRRGEALTHRVARAPSGG